VKAVSCPEATRAGPGVLPIVTLYSRKGCHLCDVAKGVLEQVRTEREFELVILDIDTDAGLVALYDTEVPVVAIDGRKAFKYRVDRSALRDRLERAGSVPASRHQ
jgi:glutaredoxin